MGQRVLVVSQTEYSNILGIFTNVKQCRKHILTLQSQENILLHEIRLNEPEKGRVNMTKLLTLKESDLKNIGKQKIELLTEAEKVTLQEIKLKEEKEKLEKEKLEKNKDEICLL
jgi:hypothetical protein